VRKIVLAAGSPSFVLEIGPGPGVLTEPLSQLAPTCAIEADSRMAALVKGELPNVHLIESDALLIDWTSLLEVQPAPRAIVSNMPYNITGPLLGKVCDCFELMDRAVLMMQKEVADRLLAPAGNSDRGSLSVVMQRLFAVEKVVSAPPGAFLPPPKVESTVLKFVPRPGVKRETGFETFVRAGFRQPRKTLANNLSDRLSGVDTDGLPKQVRPHQLVEADWIRLYHAFLDKGQG